MLEARLFVFSWRTRLDKRMPDELRRRLNELMRQELCSAFEHPSDYEHILIVADKDTMADAAIRTAARRAQRAYTDRENAGNELHELYGRF